METNYNGHSTKSGIYQIRNLNNGKVYVGSAKRFKSRYAHHITSLRKGTHHNKHLQGAFELEGTDSFIFEVLEVVEGEQSDRLIVEQKHLNSYKENWELCYNFKKEAEASSRSCFSKTPEETRKLISENAKRQWSDPEWKEKTIKKLQAAHSTLEARANLSAGLRAAWANDETRKEEARLLMAKRWAPLSYEERCAKFETNIHSPESLATRAKTQRKNIEAKQQAKMLERCSSIVETVEFWDGGLVSRAKLFENANLLSPSGVLYVSIRNLNAFANQFGMTHKESWKLQQVIEGSRWKHKGWIKKLVP